MIADDFHDKIADVREYPDLVVPNTHRWYIEFTNGWACSVVQGPMHYSGPNNNLYELAVMNEEGCVDHNNPVLGDQGVDGFLTEEMVTSHLRTLASFTAEQLHHYQVSHPVDTEEEEGQ